MPLRPASYEGFVITHIIVQLNIDAATLWVAAFDVTLSYAFGHYDFHWCHTAIGYVITPILLISRFFITPLICIYLILPLAIDYYASRWGRRCIIAGCASHWYIERFLDWWIACFLSSFSLFFSPISLPISHWLHDFTGQAFAMILPLLLLIRGCWYNSHWCWYTLIHDVSYDINSCFSDAAIAITTYCFRHYYFRNIASWLLHMISWLLFVFAIDYAAITASAPLPAAIIAAIITLFRHAAHVFDLRYYTLRCHYYWY